LLQSLLQNDGGSTVVDSEKPGSPTIDAGDPAKCPRTDQRGYPRPDVASTACDIGSDEYSAALPVIKVPAEIVTPATSSSGAVVTFTVEATDSGSLVKKLECAPTSGSTFPIGTTKVVCTATDGHENKATDQFNVTVTSPPTVTSITPIEGTTAGGTAVTIKGTGFLTGATVTIGNPATSVTVKSATEITATTAATTAGADEVIVKDTNGTSTLGPTYTYVTPATSPEAEIRQLLHEVSSSNISPDVRRTLSCLLTGALHSLAGLSGYEPSRCDTAFGSRRGDMAMLRRQESMHPSACADLRQFVVVIENDQHSHKPKIPAKLATAWIQSAHKIEASLGCRTPAKQASRHSGRHAHHVHRPGHHHSTGR
jgi:hypothetical protein